jgi:ADP-ribose pyrophosphatase YjhB (NUDIX family)
MHPGRPIVGVGAVVVHESRVLLVKRGHAPLKGEWNLPGGALELGETLVAAVAREVLEETGLRVDVGPVVEILDHIQRDEDGGVEYHHVIVDYKCRSTSDHLERGSDADDVRWVELSELGALGVTPAAIAVVRKALSLSWPDASVPTLNG